MKDRKTTLLKATYNLLKKCAKSRHVLDVLEETVKYNGMVCDGYSLMEDIKDELGLEDE